MRGAVCGNVVGTSTGGESGSVQSIQRKQCDFGTYTWVQVKLPSKSVWVAFETNLVQKCGTGRNYPVPMIHQRWDTGDAFGGSWACGPTSMLMAVAYFKKVAPKPIHNSSPHPHSNDYGWYVSNVYTSLTGKKFDRGQKDSAGKIAFGAYGTCTDGGGAWAFRMQQYAEGHGLKTKFYSKATLADIRAEIDRGALVTLSTDILPAGHIMTVRGYIAGGDTLYINDPWGNGFAPEYGRRYNGENVQYQFGRVKPKWMVSVWQ